MKLIHTSDWHLGQNFYRYSRADEHLHFLRQLEAILADHRPDCLVVSGDVFDNAAPTAQAKRLFVEAVLRLHDAAPQTAIVITAGNHDSGSRLEAESLLWQRLGVHVIGGVTRDTDGGYDPAQFCVEIPGKGVVAAVPFIHPGNYPSADPDTPRDSRQQPFFQSVLDAASAPGLPVVLMAHLAVSGCDTRGHDDKEVGGMLKDDISALGTGYDYLALGHIHMPQQIDSRTCYCGSPFPLSFAEDYPHYVNLVEIDAHGLAPRIRQIEIESPLSVRTVPADPAPLEDALKALEDLPADCPDYVRVLVDQKDVLPPDAEDRARAIVADKACRFCELRTVVHAKEKADIDAIEVKELAEFAELDPMKIARRHYLKQHNEEMDTELADMLQSVIDSLADPTDA